jgi:glycerate kinase
VGENLELLKTIDISGKHKRLDDVSFTVIYDVKNPLIGANGAAHTFAPQKGASPSEVIRLDEGLAHFAKIVFETYGTDINFPGAGAAGGLGGGANVFLKAVFSPGIDFILHFSDLENHIREADLVITGEGKIDEQTFEGKVVQGVARLAKKYNKRCIAYTGKLDLAPDRVPLLGVEKVIALTDGKVTVEESMRGAYGLLRGRVVS